MAALPTGRPRDRPDRAGRRRDRRDARSSPASASLDIGRALDRRRVAPLRLGRGRLVPGGPPDRRRPRPDRPDGRASASTASRPAAFGYAPLPSPDGTPLRPHRGPRRAAWTSSSATSPAPSRPKRGRGRPPKTPRTVAGGRGRAADQPVGRRLAVGRLAVGRRVGRRDRRERDPPAGPVAAAGPRRRPGGRPAAPGHRLDAGRARRRARAEPRPGRRARRPHGARRPAARGHALAPDRGDRQARRPARPDDRLPARRPDLAVVPRVPAVQAAARRGRASPSSTSTSAARPATAARSAIANHDEWGHADLHDVIDAARWAAGQPWSDGRLAVYGGSYGGYLVLCALVEEPALWRAGVDLFGDSEIAESYRHGDRPGRLDLHRMMGSPDDAGARGRSTAAARRSIAPSGSRRPLLILHGRKDKRVVPLMTERMVEALEIEGKTLRGPLVRRRGPRLGAPGEPPRRVRADPRVPPHARPRRAAGRLSPCRPSVPRPPG